MSDDLRDSLVELVAQAAAAALANAGPGASLERVAAQAAAFIDPNRSAYGPELYLTNEDGAMQWPTFRMNGRCFRAVDVKYDSNFERLYSMCGVLTIEAREV